MHEETVPIQCEFFIVRYVPDLVRGESLNIGVLIYCHDDRYLECLLMQDLWRIRSFCALTCPRFLYQS